MRLSSSRLKVYLISEHGLMSMNEHISKACKKAFFGLYNIKEIRKYVSTDATKMVVHALGTCQLDYSDPFIVLYSSL